MQEPCGLQDELVGRVQESAMDEEDPLVVKAIDYRVNKHTRRTAAVNFSDQPTD